MQNIILSLIILSISGAFIFYSFSILSIFLLAFILAYLLYPIVNKMALILPINKNIIIFAAILFFISLFLLILSFIIPFLIQETSILISQIPRYQLYIQNEFIPFIDQKLSKLDPIIVAQIKRFVSDKINLLSLSLLNLLGSSINYTITTIKLIFHMFIVPVLAFYIIQDWEKMIITTKSLFPPKFKRKILDILNKVDSLLSKYLRGQLNICIILCLYYIIALSAIKLQFSISMGIISGVLIIIPYIGITLSMLISLTIGYFHYSYFTYLFYILAVYACGHVLESYILIPKIMGDNVGLRPFWILFALIYFGSFFGIVGLIIAIPVSGIIKILLNLVVKQYKNSSFYK